MTRAQLILLYLGIACLYALTSSGRIAGADAMSMFKVTANIAEHGSVSAEPCDAARPQPQCVPGVDGRSYSAYGILASLAALPAYEIARAIAGRAHLPAGLAAGFLVVLSTALVAAAVPVVLARWASTLGYSRRACIATAIALAFASPLWHHGVKGFYSEPFMALALVLSAYLVLHGRSDAALAAGGLCVGLACAARVIAVLALPVFAAVLHLRLRRGHHRIAGMIWYLAPAACVLAAIGWYDYVRFGSALSTGYQWIYPTAAALLGAPLLEGLRGYLVGGDTGLLWFAPLVIPAAWAFPAFYRNHRLDALLCLSTLFFNVLFFTKFSDWHGGWSYGPRLLVPVLAFAFLPLADVFDRGRGALRIGACALLAISIAIHAAGSVCPLARYYQANRYTSARAGREVSRGLIRAMLLDLPAVIPSAAPGGVRPPANPLEEPPAADPARFDSFDAFVQSFPNPVNLTAADFWFVKAALLLQRPVAAGAAAALLLILGLGLLALALRANRDRMTARWRHAAAANPV